MKKIYALLAVPVVMLGVVSAAWPCSPSPGDIVWPRNAEENVPLNTDIQIECSVSSCEQAQVSLFTNSGQQAIPLQEVERTSSKLRVRPVAPLQPTTEYTIETVLSKYFTWQPQATFTTGTTSDNAAPVAADAEVAVEVLWVEASSEIAVVDSCGGSSHMSLSDATWIYFEDEVLPAHYHLTIDIQGVTDDTPVSYVTTRIADEDGEREQHFGKYQYIDESVTGKTVTYRYQPVDVFGNLSADLIDVVVTFAKGQSTYKVFRNTVKIGGGGGEPAVGGGCSLMRR